MKILIDVSRMHALNKSRGVGSYVTSLSEALITHYPDDVFNVVKQNPSYTDYDLVHFPYFDLFFSTLPNPKKIPIPTIVTCHDVIPLVYPAHYPPGIRGTFNRFRQIKKLQRTNLVITDSECSRRDIQQYCDIDESSIRVTYLAASDGFGRQSAELVSETLSRYQISEPYFLYVGDINFNKNIPGLLKTFSKIDSQHILVIVSKALASDIPESREIHSLLRTLNILDRVKILTSVPGLDQHDLPSLYTGADWYIQPSYYEGFGLPVLEAMKCEAPVLSSKGGSLGEIVSDAGLLFDPQSSDDFYQKLMTTTTMSLDKKEALIKKGIERARSYSWAQTARETYEAYIEILNS